MFNNLSSEELKRAFSNPFYCLPQIDPVFIEEHEPLINEEEWIKANEVLIKEIGAREWLTLLLENLKGNYLSNINKEDN